MKFGLSLGQFRYKFFLILTQSRLSIHCLYISVYRMYMTHFSSFRDSEICTSTPKTWSSVFQGWMTR